MAEAVRVHACLDPLSKKQESWWEHDNVSIARVVRRVPSRYRKCRVAVLLNGRVVDPTKYEQTRARQGDLVNLKVVQRFGGSPIGTAASLGIGILSLGAMWLLGKIGNSNNKSSATSSSSISPPPEKQPEPITAPIDNYGGPAVSVIPAIGGIQNTSNNFGPIPNVYGEDVLMYPVKLGEYTMVIGGKQRLYCLLIASIGQCDVNDLKLGDTLLSTLKAQGLADYKIRYGSPGDLDSALTIVTKDPNQVNVNADLTSVSQLATTGQDARELAVDIFFPNGLYGNTQIGLEINSAGLVTVNQINNGSKIEAVSVDFLIEYRLHGSGGAWTSFTHTVNQRALYSFFSSATWTVPTEGIYDVRITRTTSTAPYVYTAPVPGVTGGTFTNTVTRVMDATWLSLKAIRNVNPINTIKDVNGNHYPLTLIEMWVQASQVTNGTLRNLSCKLSRYLKTFDGVAWTAPVKTASLAWAYADAVTGFINDGRLDTSYVNGPDLKTWNDFCVTKNFKYNRIITQSMSLEELLDEIAAHGLATSTKRDGVFSVVIDNERSEMVALITPDLTSNLEWTAEWPDYPHAIKIKFRNREADWEQDERTVYLEDENGVLYTEATATDFETIELPGCADAEMAWKLARRWGLAPILRPIKYEFDIDDQHLVAKLGDMVGLNYDVSFDGLSSGLINSLVSDATNITGLVLSQPVIMEGGKQYGIVIRLKDLTFISKSIMTVPGEIQQITFENPIPLVTAVKPEELDAFAFGLLGNETSKCLIQSIEHTDDLGAHVTLLEYSSTLFNADSGVVPPYTPNVQIRNQSSLPVIAPPQILAVESGEDALLEVPSGYQSRIQVTIAGPTTGGVGSVQYQYRLTGNTDWIGDSTVALSNIIYVSGVVDRQTYDVQLRFVSNVFPGLSSDWTIYPAHTVVGQSTPPPDVRSFRRVGNLAVLKYDADSGVVVPKDHAGFIFRWARGKAASWNDMQQIGGVTTAYFLDMASLPQGDIIVAVKAVDKSGNESVNAAYLSQNVVLGEFRENEYVVETPESDLWSGIKTNFTQVGNELWADASGNLFWGATGSPFWGPGGDAFWGTGYLSASYEFEFLPPGDLNQPYRIFMNLHDAAGNELIDADTSFVLYKRNSQSAFWGTDGADSFWGPGGDAFWDTTGSDVWLPFPQEGIEGSREKFTVKIVCLASSAKRPKLKAGIGVVYDVPDVIEDQTITCAAGTGTNLVLTKTYREIRGIQVTCQIDPAYPTAISGAVDLTGSVPVVYALDALGNKVDGKVFVQVKGV